ncbi:MAG: IS66 family insertion sequence element accessory protein TnpA [Lachnospiraceae bacterium]
MDKKVAEIRHEHWRRTVYECINRDPRISKRQWCEENGIRLRSLMYWQRKFQQEAIGQMQDSGNVPSVRTVQPGSPAFADITDKLSTVRLGQDSSSGYQEGPSAAPELMIQAGAYRIYVNGSIQSATLEKVMQVLSRA